MELVLYWMEATLEGKGQTGVTFHDWSLHKLRKAIEKTSILTILIDDNYTGGDTIPPHLQFITTAQFGENMRLKPTYGTNAKSGWIIWIV